MLLVQPVNLELWIEMFAQLFFNWFRSYSDSLKFPTSTIGTFISPSNPKWSTISLTVAQQRRWLQLESLSWLSHRFRFRGLRFIGFSVICFKRSRPILLLLMQFALLTRSFAEFVVFSCSKVLYHTLLFIYIQDVLL